MCVYLFSLILSFVICLYVCLYVSSTLFTYSSLAHTLTHSRLHTKDCCVVVLCCVVLIRPTIIQYFMFFLFYVFVCSWLNCPGKIVQLTVKQTLIFNLICMFPARYSFTHHSLTHSLTVDCTQKIAVSSCCVVWWC